MRHPLSYNLQIFFPYYWKKILYNWIISNKRYYYYNKILHWEQLHFVGNENMNSKYSFAARLDLISQRQAGTLSWDQMGTTFKKYFNRDGGEINCVYYFSSFISSFTFYGNKAITDCVLCCPPWQCSVTRPHPELAEMTSGQSEAGLTGPRPMRGLHGRCHGNVRICGKLVASAGNSISHIPAPRGSATL